MSEPEMTEQQKAIVALSKYLVEEFAKNLRADDKQRQTNPIEILLRSAIKHVVDMLGDQATAETVATGLYEVLHIGDNINYALSHRVLLPTAARRHKPKVL